VAAIAIAVAAAAALGVVVRARSRTSSQSGASGQAATAAHGAGPVCPVPDAEKGNVCLECAAKNCCAERLACHDSSACGDYFNCWKTCDNHAHDCHDTCSRKYPEGHALAAPYLACDALKCFGPCTPPGADAKCVACKYGSCQTQAASCLSDPACDALYACDEACGPRNDACTHKCLGEQTSATQQKFNEYQTCSITYCAGSCGGPAR
jgi:hypothetical protein